LQFGFVPFKKSLTAESLINHFRAAFLPRSVPVASQCRIVLGVMPIFLLRSLTL